MKVTHLAFLGTKTGNFTETVKFFQEVLGLPIRFENYLWTGFALPSGRNHMVEVFGDDDLDPRLIPAEAGARPLLAFEVEDLEGAYQELLAAGVEIIGEIVWASDFADLEKSTGYGWVHFRAPDNNIYTLVQDK